MQWNIASKTTLTRKITDEGWTRRIARIATHLALLQIAGEAEPPPSDEAKKIDGDRRTPPPS